MIIAVPLSNSQFSQHFGGADTFALYTADEANRSIAAVQKLQPPEHGRGVFPAWLKKHGATIILAGGMGPRAIALFESQGIDVQLGVAESDPDEAVRKFLAGTLVATGEACNDHGFHDCGHHQHDAGHSMKQQTEV